VICSALIFCGCSDSSDEQLAAAVNLAKQGKWQETAAIADKVAEDAPESVAPMLLQALAYEKNGEIGKAIDMAQRCVEKNPDDFTALYTLGRLYSLDPKRQDKAYTVLEKAITLRKGDVNTLTMLCNIGMKNNEPTVRIHLEQLVRRTDLSDPEKGKAYYMLGICLYKENKKNDAVKAMKNAERFSREKNPELLFYIARFYDENIGSDYQAVSLYRRFISRYSKIQGFNPELIKEAEANIKRLSR
jgi:tetratricopeptide (TPR) repeat protein